MDFLDILYDTIAQKYHKFPANKESFWSDRIKTVETIVRESPDEAITQKFHVKLSNENVIYVAYLAETVSPLRNWDKETFLIRQEPDVYPTYALSNHFTRETV